MKKLSKPVLAIFLTAILLLSTAVVSFAGDDSDPLGMRALPGYKWVKK